MSLNLISGASPTPHHSLFEIDRAVILEYTYSTRPDLLSVPVSVQKQAQQISNSSLSSPHEEEQLDEGLIAQELVGAKAKESTGCSAQGSMEMVPLATSPSQIAQPQGHGLGSAESLHGMSIASEPSSPHSSLS
ncbi:uncharacterized protein TRIVIDRAFT_218378 [Trichoderma virens Gv29-8]|uniref:Uncharacterized protein n=1 Tax=Hypocrea virens (strain Gv29-8 / FGSC 10586) TaxID=413071 RepID=G9MHL9_HYPVG|nr:uncharacterized protein TRIVIDRAFT_218378 [Trichoderma virens Gv29-8]EHK26207.1 hypothetical protein TRIVIDRAFT_218378 [Trichoderma virens Gv29-8]UKZ46393.1 hypothetical protein TrVGV298_000594 [Trichoderma virens]